MKLSTRRAIAVYVAAILAGVLFVSALISLAGCGSGTRAGSAQEQAASATERHASLRTAADTAATDAAAKTARAEELTRQAEAQPTEARIAAAASARIEAASALAVASALADREGKAATEAQSAAQAASAERARELKQADERWWLNLSRGVGMFGLGAAILLGGIVGYLVKPSWGIGIGALVATASLSCAGFGATFRWLPLVVLVTVILGVIAWALAHWRLGKVGRALSKSLDLAEADPRPGIRDQIDAAKEELKAAITAAGLKESFNALRGEDRNWGLKDPADADTAEFKPHAVAQGQTP